MAALTSGQLDLLRNERHIQEIWLSAVPKIVLWTARINDPAIVKSETVIAFDSGATDPSFPAVGFADVEPLQTVWVGSTAGDNNVGKLRIKQISSGDGGITGSLTVGGHSLDLTDDLYLTFIHMYEINPMWPDIDETTEVFYKDDDITYAAAGDPNDPPASIGLFGPNRAMFLDAITGEAVATIDMSASYITVPATTIDTYAVSVVPAATATVNVSGSTGIGDITFSAAGVYWVKFSITDSNGRTSIGYRAFYIHSLDPNSTHYPITNFKVNSLGGTWDEAGYKLSVELYDEADFDKIPDSTIIILWGDTYYNDTQENINFLPAYFNDILFGGYVLNQQIRHDNVQGAHVTVFECATPQAILKNIYTYSIPLEASGAPDDWDKYPNYLTPRRAAYFVLEWHATVTKLCDFVGVGILSPAYFRKYFEYTEGSLYEIVDQLTYQAASREKLLCDQAGRFHFVRDMQLAKDATRASTTVIANFSDRDIGPGPIEIVHNEATTGVTWSSGFSYDGAGGEPEPWYAIAPGLKPNRRGAGTTNYERQTFVDQEDALATVGRYWSRDNNPYPEIRLNLHGNYYGVFCPYVQEWWEIDFASSDTTRKLIWTDKKLLCRGVSAEFIYENNAFTGIVRATATMEVEAPPARGVPWEYGTLPPIDIYEEPDWPSTNGGIMTAGSVQFLPPLTSTWVERSTEDTLDLYEDPYWPYKQGANDSNQAIVWRCGVGYIKRTTDAGLNWTTVTPATDPPNTYGDSPAPTVANLTFKVLTPNYSFGDEFVVGAVWSNGSEWRSWLAHTVNDGTSWTWIAVV